VATECLASFGPQVGPFFQAATFLQFERDGAGAISLPLFVQYMSQHANAMQLVRSRRGGTGRGGAGRGGAGRGGAGQA
jgi:hypothetical protein